MANLKFNFDPKKLAKQLEEQARQHVQQEFKKNPARYLDDRIGEIFAGHCPTCGKAEIKIIKGAKGICQSCKRTLSIDPDIKWR